MHGDSILTAVLAPLAIILIAAKLAGALVARFGQPAVLGELLAGVVLGNLSLVGFDGLVHVIGTPGIDVLARLGVLLLLFEIGLESTVAQMAKVGVTATAVAVLGVVAPLGLGWVVAALLLPEQPAVVHAFIGAALSATSVGITARVLKDLGRAGTAEARVILGAAVIDDVLGLLVLAAVGGAVAAANLGAGLSVAALGLVVLKAAGFLVGALLLGRFLAPLGFRAAARLRTTGVLLAFGLASCFLLAWLAGLAGLAPIVGAFVAGLILEDPRFHDLHDFAKRGESPLSQQVQPLTSFLAPVFFVLMGMRTSLASFADGQVLLLAGGLTVVAVAGKLACALAVRGRELDRLSIGIGMIPRGEVGLIFADVGAGLLIAGQPVIGPAVFSAVVAMVIFTTVITPPALKFSLNRRRPVAAVPEAAVS